ncbi:MAG: helix-turn-helix domain-containing protein [Planctomycetia bacterium]|nr:helix-turn-helix domain-containing protein [Planctomycetia bacterium]
MAEKYLAVEEVAALLNITNAEVISATTSGQLRGYKDGSAWKFRSEDVEKYMKEQRAAASSANSDDEFGYESYDLDSDIGGSSDINATLDGDVQPLEDSSLELSDYDGDDGDLVLGEDDGVGSSTGSGLTLGEGSGISLMSATDSGIALDDDTSGEVLELGEDDMLQFGSGLSGSLSGSLASSLSGTGEENFKLTTDDEFGDDEDSGSQVIVLDENQDGAAAGDGMFDDAMGGMGDTDGGESFAPMMDPALQAALLEQTLPEKPYTILNIISLVGCFLFLTFTLMFTLDLVRNMWSWNQPTTLNSAMMDWVVETFLQK